MKTSRWTKRSQQQITERFTCTYKKMRKKRELQEGTIQERRRRDCKYYNLLRESSGLTTACNEASNGSNHELHLPNSRGEHQTLDAPSNWNQTFLLLLLLRSCPDQWWVPHLINGHDLPQVGLKKKLSNGWWEKKFELLLLLWVSRFFPLMHNLSIYRRDAFLETPWIYWFCQNDPSISHFN